MNASPRGVGPRQSQATLASQSVPTLIALFGRAVSDAGPFPSAPLSAAAAGLEGQTSAAAAPASTVTSRKRGRRDDDGA